MKKIAISIIKIYQKTLSPDKGFFQIGNRGCRFYPTCSQYAVLSIEKYGALKGAYLGAKRILKCHPWHEGGYDPVE